LPVIAINDNSQKKVTIKLEKPTAAKLVIESAPNNIEIQNTSAIPTKTITDNNTTKLGSLSKIRQQLANKNDQPLIKRVLDKPLLNQAWESYIEKLINNKNHSAVTNFKLATLLIVDDNSFNIITESNIQLKFIESERVNLIDHLQQFFNNKLIKYQLTIEEKESEKNAEIKTIGNKELYKILSEQYPFIKELKEKLKLEL